MREKSSELGRLSTALNETFAQLEESFARQSRFTAGAGLGLAICKTIADAHGGTLEVTSAVGSGSTFTLRLPLSVSSCATPACLPS